MGNTNDMSGINVDIRIGAVGSENMALVEDKVVFYYGLVWSRDETWNGESKPRAGDTVFVPEGSVLIVDESSPKYLLSVVVEGIIIFADNQDIEFDVSILLIRGTFIAGLEDAPYQNNLKITLYGERVGK